jgi:hypothetical protein
MRCIVGGFLVLVLAGPALWAQDQSRKATDTPGRQYQALLEEFADARQALDKAAKEARTEAEREKVLQDGNPTSKLAPRFLELAEKNPKDPVAVDALVWVASRVGEPAGARNAIRARALEILSRDHVTDARTAGLCEELSYRFDPETQAFLRAMLAKSPQKEVQGRACLTLALSQHNRFKQRQLLAEGGSQLDSQAVADLQRVDPAGLVREVEDLLQRCADQYGDIQYRASGAIGKMAERELYELHDLVVGKPVPEIEGEDQDGKKFKLSDYRGKVVLLDFWGHW